MKKLIVSLFIVLSFGVCINTPAYACNYERIEMLLQMANNEITSENFCTAYKLFKRADEYMKKGRCEKAGDSVVYEILQEKLHNFMTLSLQYCETYKK